MPIELAEAPILLAARQISCGRTVRDPAEAIARKELARPDQDKQLSDPSAASSIS